MISLQAKYSTLTRERLEKLFDDSLRKLKARDKELAAVTADRADLKLQVQTASEALAHQDGLTEQLKVATYGSRTHFQMSQSNLE